MREDMFKVIVERPRLVNSNGYSRDGRKFRNDEDAPARLGMKRGYSQWKWFNENLAPLRRYLERQVNRPWDKVYSEIRANIDPRSTVKQHILQHIEDFVAVDTHWVETPGGGKIIIRGRRWPRKDVFLEESTVRLYVNPRTGILLLNRRHVSHGVRKRQKQQAQHERQLAVRRELGEHEQLHRVEGIWYHVTLETLPAAKVQIVNVDGKLSKKIVYASCWDVVRKEWVSRKHGRMPVSKSQASNQDMYGDPNKYAASKRQLNSQELKRHGLND